MEKSVEQILMDARGNYDIDYNTVYCVHPKARKSLERVASCENENDAESIANFFRDRDKSYIYVWTNNLGHWTILEALI
jgi:hypothetical protein